LIAGGDLVNVRCRPSIGSTAGLFDKISYARQKGVKDVWFSTNGILFGHKDVYKKVVDAKLQKVHISTPRFNREYYRKIFGVDKADEVVDGLVKLAAYKKSKGDACTTILELSFHLEETREQMLQSAAWQQLTPYIDDGTFTVAHFKSVAELLDANFPAELGPAPRAPDKLYVDDWSGTVTNETLPENWVIKPVTHMTTDVPCSRLFNDLTILPDGKVRLCALRYMTTSEDELVIGRWADRAIAGDGASEGHLMLLARARERLAAVTPAPAAPEATLPPSPRNRKAPGNPISSPGCSTASGACDAACSRTKADRSARRYRPDRLPLI
jgi:hypothetical protein